MNAAGHTTETGGGATTESGRAAPADGGEAERLYPLSPLPWPLWLVFTVNLAAGAAVADRAILPWAALVGLGLDALVWLRVWHQARRYPHGVPASTLPWLGGFETSAILLAMVPVGWLAHVLLFVACRGGCDGLITLAEAAAPYQPHVADIIATFDRLGRAREGRDIAVHALFNIAYTAPLLGLVAWRTAGLVRAEAIVRGQRINIDLIKIVIWIIFFS